MAKVKIIFHECIQDSQEFGSDDEHMVSRVFFSLEADDHRVDNLFADLKQVVGSDFEIDPIEVTAPHNYSGPMNYDAFRKAAEEYFRKHIGSQGSGIRIGEGAKNIRMQNNRFVREESVEFEAPDFLRPW